MPDKYIEEEIERTKEPEEEAPPAPEPEPWRDEMMSLKGAVENLTLQFQSFGQPQAAPAPAGPTQAEQIAKIDEQLVKLDTALDNAAAEGQPLAAIQRKREDLIQRKTDIKYNTKIEELQSFGTYAIDQLTDKIVAGDMPMLKYPEVKEAYDQAISTMGPDQRMNPEVRMTAYNYACGKNQTTIFDKMFEERMRADKEVETQAPSAPGRTVSQKDDPNRIPDPSEYLTPENMQALESAGKTVDSYYKSQGYDDWADFWTKTGKSHFIGEEDEE